MGITNPICKKICKLGSCFPPEFLFRGQREFRKNTSLFNQQHIIQYCWWFRNPKQPPFGCKKTCKNGLNYQPQLLLAGFLNHQHYNSQLPSISRSRRHPSHLRVRDPSIKSFIISRLGMTNKTDTLRATLFKALISWTANGFLTIYERYDWWNLWKQGEYTEWDGQICCIRKPPNFSPFIVFVRKPPKFSPSWICLFDDSKIVKTTYYPKWWFDCDEYHGTIH